MELREKFKLKVLQSSGQQYEEIFSQIMIYTHHDFKLVKPHGNIGDRGNDGWIANTGTYYQVYAPEELSTNTKTAQSKVKEDFKKLKLYWDSISPIQTFYFVLNDKFQGVSPHITKTLEEIKVENSLYNCDVFDTSNLERALFNLPTDIISMILGSKSNASDEIYEDKKKVREFIEGLWFVFDQLQQLGGEAGYFFPSNIFYYVSENFSSDWSFTRLKSKDHFVATNQEKIRDALISMYNQISNDHYYEDIGASFKYKPPFDLKGRNDLIEKRKNSMRSLVSDLLNAYENIKNYAA